MEKFIVSARKYRPQNFNTVVGQSHITTTLKNAIQNNQLAHAFLFCGPRGVGKTTCARILAKTINCENRTEDGEACNVCNSCVSFEAGTSLNIHELDAASNNSVDDIRSLVEQVRFAPQAGKYKVYIVDEVHMLSSSAFNAFLKTLEEPPSYAIFILATTEKHKILPTILSRCQIFDFKRITHHDTVGHLQEIAEKEHITAEKAALQVIAQKSEGCMRDSLSILDKIVSFTSGSVTYQNTLEHLNILDYDYFFQMLNHLTEQKIGDALLLFDEINQKGFEGDQFLNGFSAFMRDLLVCKDEKAIVLLDVVEGMEEKYKKVAATCSFSYLVSALNILQEAEFSYKMAKNRKLHVEFTLIKLNYLPNAIDLAKDGTAQVVKKKRIDQPVALKTKSLQPFQSTVAESTSSKPASTVSQQPKEAVLKVQVKTVPQSVPPPPPVLPAEKPVAKKSSDTLLSGQLPGLPKKNLLQALRDKYGDEYRIDEVKEAAVLNLEKLLEVRDQFCKSLTELNKLTAANTFQSAIFDVIDEINFSVGVHAVVAQKFLEAEKINFLEKVQEAFHNKAIRMQILLLSEPIIHELTPANFNSRDRFAHLANKYPLLNELREALKLQIDY